MNINLGYACINQTLASQKISCNRGMIRRTFQSKGADYAADLALHNVQSLLKIVQWNADMGIHVYRMTSCLFPWMSEYEISDLYNFEAISNCLAEIGALAAKTKQRLSFHPGQFCVLASPKESVVAASIKELDKHAEIMDWMGLPVSTQSKINIHLGGAYGDHSAAMQRFCDNYGRLGATTRARLTVENDDKPGMYSVKMLYDGVHSKIGIPIVFDSHHFQLGPQDQTYRDAFYLARSTWGSVKQMCHHSSSRQLHEDSSARAIAHSDYIYNKFENFNEPVDVVLEAKAKELALLDYLKKFE
tara:strand:+ start:43 stop:948 length:906 start_codon:yes stop_codon:yes gene_type:complete